MLVMCGCVGQSGGGWSHYVGQEKLRPQSGWLPLAFALDWSRPPRQQNSTSFFYAHTDQWRYETLDVGEIVSPTAPAGPWDGALIDYNVRAERMGWLPSAPQLESQSARGGEAGRRLRQGAEGLRRRRAEVGRAEALLPRPGQPEELAAQHVRVALQPAGLLRQGPRVFPQAPARHLARRDGQAAGRDGRAEADRCRLARRGAGRKARPAGDARLPHVDHLRLLRHRAADRHLVREERPQHLRHAPLHPPADRRGGPGVGGAQRLGDLQGDRQEVLAKSRPEVLGVEKDVVLTPIMHDTPAEIAQALDVKDWKRGECEPVPGKTMPAVTVVERDYPNLYKRFTSLGPLMSKLGNGGKGMAWNTEHEVDFLKRLNGVVTEEGPTKGLPRIESDIDAAEVILTLAPETNGEVAVKAWASLGRLHRARPHASRDAEGGREDPLPRRGGPAAQDHLLADLVGAREREGLLQRRLHQRARADPLAHADRAASSSTRTTCGCAPSARRCASTGRRSTRARSSR